MARTDEILTEELGKIGATRATCDAGMVTLAGLGAQLAARSLPNDVCRVVLDVPAAADVAIRAIAGGIADVGRLVGGDPSSPYPTLRAVIGAGFRNMNPAVVEAEVVPASDGSTRITLTGTAKEGLIKQRSGEKAVRRLIQAVRLLDDGQRSA